jgi:hypothetical protein
MLLDLFKHNRNIRIQHKKLLSDPICNPGIIKYIDKYLSSYMRFNKLDGYKVLTSYNVFLSKYTSDMDRFILTNKYPYQLDIVENINRVDYDIALILSVALTSHRHKIFNHLFKYFAGKTGDILIIGVGAGLELEMFRMIYEDIEVNIDAYDTSITSFVKDRFCKYNIIEEKFTGTMKSYDYIIAVELLEHLLHPYEFLSLCSVSLKLNGVIVTTTATNIPQFDHLYNFNDFEFENEVNRLGLLIEEKKKIHHSSFNNRSISHNTLYVLKNDT